MVRAGGATIFLNRLLQQFDGLRRPPAHREILRAVHGTVFVGSATAGANGEGSNFLVPVGSAFFLTGIGVVRADGTSVQRVGEKPDFEVTPTLAGIRSGRDEVLERGVAYLIYGSR